MIINILVGIVSITALCLSIISLCRSSKEKLDAQYIAADSTNASNPRLYTESFSTSIENWLNDKKVTFDTSGVNFGNAVNITGALSTQGDIKGTSVTSTGPLNGSSLGIGTHSSVDSNGTASFSNVTTSNLTVANSANVKGTVSSVGLITAPGITINGKTFKFSGGLDDKTGCYLTSEATNHPCS